jgi:hypothetical protein
MLTAESLSRSAKCEGRRDELTNGGEFSRNNYFEGMLLTAQCFEDEQEYFLRRFRLRNRCLHGSRVVCGLEVTIDGDRIVVFPGLALDCSGREIYVPGAEALPLPGSEGSLYVTIKYRECPRERVPVMSEPAGADSEEVEPSRILESHELKLSSDNPLAGHEWRDGAWVTCGKSHPLALARIVGEQGRSVIDRSFAKKLDAGRTCWCASKGERS